MLAAVQAKFVNTAYGGMDSSLPPITYKPASSFELDFCRNQVSESSGNACTMYIYIHMTI